MTMQLTVIHDDDLCVARVPLFRGLSRTEQEQVAALARPQRFDGGDPVHLESRLMVVHTGRLKLSRTSASGHEQLVRVLEPGDFVGESGFLTGVQSEHLAVALEDTSMCVFRHADIASLIGRHPSIGLQMLQAVSLRLAETESRLASVISGDVSSRLANYLLGLPGRRSAGGLTVELPLAKKDIASLLDTTPESLSRQLRRLSDAGLISQGSRGAVTVTDLEALLELADQE